MDLIGAIDSNSSCQRCAGSHYRAKANPHPRDLVLVLGRLSLIMEVVQEYLRFSAFWFLDSHWQTIDLRVYSLHNDYKMARGMFSCIRGVSMARQFLLLYFLRL